MTQGATGPVLKTAAIQLAPPVRRWHLELASELRARGYAVTLRRAKSTSRLPRGFGLLLAAEKRLYGTTSRLFAEVSEPVGAGSVGSFDVTVVLAGEAPKGAKSLEPLFDGIAGEGALVSALLSGRAPAITLRDGIGAESRRVAAMRPATADPLVIAHSLDDVLLRLAPFIAKGVEVARSENPVCLGEEDRSAPLSPLLHFGRAVQAKLGLRRRPEHWQILFRLRGDHHHASWPPEWPMAGMTSLPDDGRRFHADPFPFEHEGRRYIFFEDFPLKTGKGVIARVEIDRTGAACPARTVLEQPWHLSYPLLIDHGNGMIYMLPEMCAVRRVQLFRADPFPDRWVPDKILIEDVAASDATPIFHDGRWWLFATLSDDGGSSWDSLGLFHAPDLLGPWTAHRGNPVLIDAGSARPAGHMWHQGAHLMRVAQDCRRGYGSGLVICRVDQLDEDGFAQTVVERYEAPAGSGAEGVHTLNRAGTLDTIDLRLRFARRPRR